MFLCLNNAVVGSVTLAVLAGERRDREIQQITKVTVNPWQGQGQV